MYEMEEAREASLSLIPFLKLSDTGKAIKSRINTVLSLPSFQH